MTRRGRLVVFILAGIASGVLAWGGGMLLPEGSLALDLYPGAAFGVCLFLAGQRAGYGKPRPWPQVFAATVLASTASWRLAVDVGYMHGGPLPMVTAGALGALIVAAAAVWAWRLAARAWPVLAATVLTGAIAAQGADLLWKAWPAMGDKAWTLVLFLEWQTLVLVALVLTAGEPGRVAHAQD